MKKTIHKIVLVFIMMVSFSIVEGKVGYAFQTTNETYPVSQGVNYSKYTNPSSTTNVINHLEVDLTNPYTKLTLGIPSPINSLLTTTAHANKNSTEGNRVVGAINANFYNMGDGYPLYLISENNMIKSPDVISKTNQHYVNQPIAFGITANGNAEIAYYNSDIIVNYKGQAFEVDGLNVKRGDGNAIVYTPQYHSSTTPNGEYGMEFIVETDSVIGATKFGQTLTGTVTAIRGYGETTKAKIPRNGFVLSFNGKDWGEKFRDIQVGEEITVNISIDNRWMDAQYIMASGPLLVLDGKVNLTIDPNSDRAKQIAPRTAIAISKDKKTVHLITVDGSQTASKGMTLTQFANYLVKLGVDRAINLDGGGSTTMGIRKYGSNTVVLANKPSGGSERRVSAIIQAISTGLTGEAKTIKVSRNRVGDLLVGATVKLTPQYVLDEHYNPITINNSLFNLTSQNNLVSINGLTYTATSPGSERIIVGYENATESMTFNIVDAPSQLTIAGASTIEPNRTAQFTIDAKGSNNASLVYNADQVNWSITGDIGTVNANGLFTSNGKYGKATITATLGTKSVSKSIEVKQAFTGDIFAINQFESLDSLRVETNLAKASMALSKASQIGKQGKYSIKLAYDMTGNKEGTAAAYLRMKSLVQIPGEPLKIGVWMYGNEKGTWVRGIVRDSSGTKHTIDFTDKSGQAWSSWRYIEASIPKDVVFPLSFESIYIVQPDVAKQSSGTVYFDKLQAVYKATYKEPLFNDIAVNYTYETEIGYLTNKGLINGYGDGTFKPGQSLTRAHAAVLLVRALNLNTSNVKNPNFVDVSTNHTYYKEIAALVNAGIMNGSNGKFNPNDKLTRGQMAKVLVLAYDLKGTTDKKFADVSPNHGMYEYIHTLAANGITTGYSDNTFKPGAEVSRVHFTLFLYRALTK